MIKGVIGWVDLTSPQAIKQLELLSQSPRFLGIRLQLNGSDWPVTEQYGVYGDVIRLFEQSLPVDLTEEQREAIRHTNALRVYTFER